MSLDAIRAAIVTRLQSVAGVGHVHGFERYAAEQGKFRQLYESNGKITGFFVRRVSTRETSPALGRYVVTHRWQIRGFMSLVDAEQTEAAFDNLVEAIRDAFRDDDTLGGVVNTCTTAEAAGVQVDDSGPVMFAGVLCHGVRLTLFTEHVQ